MGEFAVVLIVLVSVGSIFVVLPWLFLHYFAKARSSGRLSDDEERMLEDLWRSARTMERRIDTLERLIETEPTSEASRNGRRPPQEHGR